MKLTPKDFIAASIGTHEGVLSLHPADNGNWFDSARYAAGQPQRRGLGVLVGSKFGVTAYAYADYHHLKTVTRAQIAAITFEDAVAIGVELYYHRPGFDQLVWNRVTASIFDKAWGSGPGRAIKLMQQMIGVMDDGKIGPATAKAYSDFILKNSEAGAAHLWCNKRIAFDHSLATNDGANDPDRVFENGWNNRSRSFLPESKWWANA